MSQLRGLVAPPVAVVALAITISACAVSPDGTDTPPPGDHTARVTQSSFLSGRRVCSAINPGAPFRDTIDAGDGWDSDVCARWVRSVGAQVMQLGCVFPNDFAWGTPGGGLPEPDCGW